MTTISTLHYITPNLSHPEDYLEDIKSHCLAGGKWIQLRMKEFPKAVVLKTACKAKEICDQYQCKLIINDYPEIAYKANAYGVHVGKEDKAAKDIRERYGDRLVIGATANTFADILEVAAVADYIGLGPLRFTSTKKKLSPVLYIIGYQEIMEKLKISHPALPIIAIGGIKVQDIALLKAAGVYGIAASHLLHTAQRPQQLIKEIQTTFSYAENCRQDI